MSGVLLHGDAVVAGESQAAAIRADTTGQILADLTRLFDACFRIQREACEAAGRRIPMIVENVRGAQPWVGEARANYGSYFLWGDAPLPQMTLPGLSLQGSRSHERQSVQILGHELVGPNQARAGFHADCRAASTERHQARRWAGA